MHTTFSDRGSNNFEMKDNWIEKMLINEHSDVFKEIFYESHIIVTQSF